MELGQSEQVLRELYAQGIVDQAGNPLVQPPQ